MRRTEECGLTSVILSPRPPELFDLTVGDQTATTLVYPDPPIGVIEADILDTALKSSSRVIKFVTLSEVR